MNAPLQSALHLAERGMKVFPLQRGSKDPVFTGWTESATSDAREIQSWAREYRDCNWAILTGEPSNLWVLDCDHKNGHDGLQALKQHWDLDWARTFTVRTPHDGIQLYYQWNSDQGLIRNKNPLLPGIDVRGWHGFVVAPGSILTHCNIPGCTKHPREYRILVDRPFNSHPKARQFYFKNAANFQPKPEPNQENKFGQGDRHKALLNAALKMHQAHLPPEEILETLLRTNQKCCDPPHSERHVRELVDWVTKNGYSSPSVTVGLPQDALDDICVPLDTAITTKAPDVEWVIENLLPRGSICELVATVKCGKTTLLLDWIRAIIKGEPWCGLRTRKSRVLYLTEQSSFSFNEELRFSEVTTGDMDILYRPDAISFGWTKIAYKICQWTQQRDYGLVVVDTLTRWAQVAGDSENQSGSVKLLGLLEPVLANGCTLFPVFHSGKDERGAIEHSIRGSSAWAGAGDQIYRLRRPQGRQGERARILESTGRYNHLIPEKLGLRLNDDDKYEITTRGDIESVASGAVNRVLDELPTTPDTALEIAEIIKRAGASRRTVARTITRRTDIQTTAPEGREHLVRYYRNLGSGISLGTVGISMPTEFAHRRKSPPLEPPSINVNSRIHVNLVEIGCRPKATLSTEGVPSDVPSENVSLPSEKIAGELGSEDGWESLGFGAEL
jgi:Bifunctional DNA primase/polymerase, N-terminal/AAA domain